ncbi:hypothetical protein [Falsiroseomonas sp. CW058]|uniref:hypothetical protein n=1 Tax=Falsiroseomonas sp. CW058 TaxID=3388664 RepID=UPI003D31478B
MRRRTLLAAPALLLAAAPPALAAGAMGPLTAAPGGRHFARPDGRAVHLAGSHSWTNLQDVNDADPPRPFDNAAYLDLLAAGGHNIIRLWAWEAARGGGDAFGFVDPLPYRRTGPGTDALGRPRFDLHAPDQAYFDRLRARVRAAAARGIYVSVMLWNTWSIHNYTGDPAKNPWPFHPFNAAANVNGIDGDPGRSGTGLGIQTLADPAVTALQEAYLRKVVDTLGDCDNLLYEISNEPIGDAATEAWQRHMIASLNAHQARGPRRHPVGMTAGIRPDQATIEAQLHASAADWISLAGFDTHKDDPPEADGRKVSLLDTDHLFGIGGDAAWAWKAFCRGHNLLYMDSLTGTGIAGRLFDAPPDLAATEASGRRGVTGTRLAADLVEIGRMAPRRDLCSSGYAMAEEGESCICYAEGAFTLDLRAAAGHQMQGWWIDAERGVRLGTERIAGGTVHRFAPPAGRAALVLRRMG